MDTVTILTNQLVIMKALLTLVRGDKVTLELMEQIVFTERRINALS